MSVFLNEHVLIKVSFLTYYIAKIEILDNFLLLHSVCNLKARLNITTYTLPVVMQTLHAIAFQLCFRICR